MSAVAGWLGLGLIVASAIVIGVGTTFPGWTATVPVAGAVLVLNAGTAVAPAGPARLLGIPPLAYLGRTSYAWYLWHWPCLVAAGTLAAELRDRDVSHGIVLPYGWVTTLAVAVSLGLSVISHHLVEDPIRHSARLRASRVPSLALGAGLSAAAVLAAFVILPASDGAPSGPVLADIEVGAPPHIVARPVALSMSPQQASTDRPLSTRDCYDDYQQATVGSDVSSVTRPARRRLRSSATPTPSSGSQRWTSWGASDIGGSTSGPRKPARSSTSPFGSRSSTRATPGAAAGRRAS